MFFCDRKRTGRRQEGDRKVTGERQAYGRQQVGQNSTWTFIQVDICKENENQCFTFFWILMKISFHCWMDKRLAFGEFYRFIPQVYFA